MQSEANQPTHSRTGMELKRESSSGIAKWINRWWSRPAAPPVKRNSVVDSMIHFFTHPLAFISWVHEPVEVSTVRVSLRNSSSKCQADLCPTFRKMCAGYTADSELAEAVRKWEAYETDTIYLDEAAGRIAPGCLPLQLPPAMRAKPIFQTFMEHLEHGEAIHKVLPTALYADERVVAFLPAGFRGKADKDEAALKAYRSSDGSRAAAQKLYDTLALTPLTVNPPSNFQAGGSASMSLVHVLVIPRKRIYNSTTLRTEHIELLQHMQKVGAALVHALLRADSRTPAGDSAPLEKVASTVEEVESWKAMKMYLPGGANLSEQAAMAFDKGVDTTFHVHPMNTIGWLHMHAYAAQLTTETFAMIESEAQKKSISVSVSGETVSGISKNTPADCVLAVLQDGETAVYNLPSNHSLA